MEKLLELLTEYDKCRGEKRRIYGWSKWKVELDVLIIISKKFGFIKRLVDNDKIDLVKFSDKLSNSNGTMEDRYRYLNSDFGLYHTLLMLLAISDTPIEDLVSLLKNV